TIGALTGNRNLALTNAGGAAVTLSVGNNNRDALYSGSMTQSGGLNKVGSGKWTLSGTNVYSGATVVSSGTLELTGWLTNQNTLTVSGGATLQLSGGTLGVAVTTIAANGLLTGYGTINGSLLNSGLVVVNGSLTINGGVTNNGTISVPAGSTITFNGPVVNNGVVDASAGGIVIANSTWTGNPYVGVPPGASYTNTMTGNWSVVAWQPMQPLSGIRTTNVFNNSATVSSTNDLGVFNLNQLRFDNQAVTLRGDALQFGGDAPSLVTAQNYAHTVANTLTLNEDTRVQISANTTTISGAIGGAGELVKSGAGVLALSASNSYSGGTLIADGVLAITSDNQLGAPGNDLSFTNGGTLRVTTGTITLNNRLVSLKSGGGVISNTSALTVSNSISGPGSLTKTGSGRLTLNAANSYAGGSLLNQGELYYVKSGGLGSGRVTLFSGAQFTFRPGGSTLANNITFAGTGISSRGALRLESVAVTLNGDLSLDNDAKIASDGSSSDTLTANGDVALGASTLTLAPGFATPSIIWTFNGVISGSGGLAITAPVLTSGFFRVTLANANTYSGNTTITAPASATGGTRLGLNHVNAIQNSTYDTGAAAANVTTLFLIAGNNTYNFGGLKGANALAVSGNTLNIGGNNASTIYSGAITGNGGLIKSGSGTLTLSGANAYSGGTLVSNGVLKVDASGSIGTGDLSIASGATCGIGNSAAMAVSAAVYLSGVLDLTNGVNLTVQRLYINGQLQSAGNWNAARDPAHFSGSGNLTVTDGLPAAPSALAATSISSSQINLSWIDNADNEGGFEIQRSLTSGSGYVQIATVGANAAAYSDTGLNAETLYFYRVRATNYFAGSDFSSESSATTLPNPPSAPTGLAAVGGAGEIDLSWAAAAGASSYNVKRGASSGGPYTLVVSNVNPTAYSDVNVANGTTYYYVVSGVNAGGEGGNSAEVSAMPSSAGSYTNISNGAWSTVVWQPMMTAPGLQTTNVFRNSAAVSSTNDLGDFTLNQLRFDDQAVALSGDPLTFDGVGPALIAAPDQAHSIANDLNLNQDTRFSIAQNATTVNGAINGVGALVKSGAGALNLTASNSYSGGTVIADGVLGITSDNQLGLAGSAVTFTNGGRLRITSSSVTLNDRALELQSGGGGISNTTAVILNTAVSGPGSLTKTGAGKLTLSAASTYSGGTTIGSGTLYVTGGSVLGTGPVTIPTGGMLEHNASGTMANDLTLSTSNGSRGFGGITISGSSTRTFSGAVTLGANANISGGNTANAVTWSGAFDLGAFTLTVNPNCATAVQSWAIDGAVTGTGGLTLAAPGLTSGTLTLRLGGANTYSGETLLSAQSGATGAARLALANVAALQNSTLNTGAAGGAQEVTFAVSGFNTYALGGLTGADALDLGGNSIDVGANGSTTTYSGEISGAGGFTKSGTGTLTLSGVNTFSGGTLVSGGTLLVDATGALGSGDLTVSAGANCTIQNGTAMATNATVSLVGVMAVDNGVALTVQKLYLNGQLQSPGIWNAARDA
ncbi:MAG: beta strand repeat-containing protein, partial [Verrucomicrobiota bacterium]